MSMRRHPVLRRSVALVLAWATAVTSLLWAAPPIPPAPPGPPQVFTPYVPQPTPLSMLQEALAAPASWSPPPIATTRVVAPAPPPAPPAPVAPIEPAVAAEPPPPEPVPQAAPGLEVEVFGPRRFVRTKGPKNVYTETVEVPPWVTSPYRLHVQNGEPDGTFRVSSATIEIDGAPVAETSDFDQNVASLDRDVTLTPQTSLVVTLASKPTSYLTINLFAESADLTPPAVTWVDPAPASTINDPTPHLHVDYADLVGAGEPAASGVDTATLVVLIDGIDRTDLFTRRPDEATAELPESLSLTQGTHTLSATLADRAGNVGQTSLEFTVDLTAPAIDLVEPAGGAFLPTQSPVLRVAYQDDFQLDLGSLRVLVNGVDRTDLFTVGAEEAIADLTGVLSLPNGPNQVTARIEDRGGNEATASTSFHVDVVPPQLTIGHPVDGSRLGSASVAIAVQYADDQKLDPSSFQATLDGAPIVLEQTPDGASGTVGPLSDDLHVLETSIFDQAGNSTLESSSFYVDTTVPDITVTTPTGGSILSTAEPDVALAYSDNQGVDTSTLSVLVNGTDRSALFTVGPDSATATLGGEASLPEGSTTVAASIRDLTGNRGDVESTFTVDTIPPSGSIDEPGARTNDNTPAVRVSYADGSGTGVDPARVLVFVDDVDRTSLFAVGSESATAVLDAPLADGDHVIRLEVEDRAGNRSTFPHAFTVDTLEPTAAFAAPLKDSFINDPTPSLRLTYDDGAGTGVDLASLAVSLASGNDPEVDVTGLLAVEASDAEGAIPDTSPLADGTHTLRATLSDLAGNAIELESAFSLDTVAPTFRIEAPAADGYEPTATPSFLIRYEDDASGVDTARLVLLVDGVDRTERLTLGPAEATGALLPEDALAEGPHSIELTVLDLAGNAAPAPPHVFTVDTIDPTAAVELPLPGSVVATPEALHRLVYGDAGGSGIDPASVLVEIDGVDRTPEFAVTETAAEATLTLGDGAHTVQVTALDWAGNAAIAAGTYLVDTQPPVLSFTDPPEGSFLGASPAVLTGTLQDADPQTTVQCSAGAASADAVLSVVASGPDLTQWSFTCSVPLDEGANDVQAVATDRAGRQSTAARSLVLDTVLPDVTIVQPADGDFTNEDAIEVSGGVVDDSPVTVRIEGPEVVEATVAGSSFSGLVPLASVANDSQAVLRVVAEDAAGNVGESSVTVSVDRTPPFVEIGIPADGAFVSSPVAVSGSATDSSPVVLVEVNGEAVPVSGGAFTTQIPAGDGTLVVQATAFDAAGNTAADAVTVNVDSTPPVIDVSSPADGFVTAASSVVVSGTVDDESPVSLTLDGVDVEVSQGAFSVDAPLSAEETNVLALVAIDAAGNRADRSVEVVRDTTPPDLFVAGPAAGEVVSALPAIVQGTVADATAVQVTVDGQPATVTQGGWQISIPSLPETPHTFDVVAADAAGNQTRVLRDVLVDLEPPQVVIATPAEGTLTRSDAVDVTGTVTDATDVTVSVSGVSATVSGSSPFDFTALGVPVGDGDNTLVAVATDRVGRTGQAQVVVTQDAVPPDIDLTTPDVVSKLRPDTAVAGVTDNVAVAQVTMSVNGSVVQSFTEPPYSIALEVPEGVAVGDTIVVSAEATDTAGNVASASRGVRVITDGVVVGRVLTDETSLPLAEATVRLGERSEITDERGRYSISTVDAQAMLVVEKDQMTTVTREIEVESGVGTIPVDARLTTLAAEEPVGSGGGTLEAEIPGGASVDVAVPAGAVSDGSTFQLTALSAQALPGLLPLGWSPVAAFDLRASVPVPALLLASASSLPVEDTVELHLVQHRPAVNAWILASSFLTVASGATSFELSELGAYALVVADATDPALVLPAEGEVLPGVDAELLPASVTSSGTVDPPVIPPSGGVSEGSLSIFSPVPLPSGTVIQAQVTETYTLSSGDVASEESRLEDIVLFQRPAPEDASLAATFPIAPSRTFENVSELVQGTVHLDILAGRESVRGRTGGREALTLEDGDARLVVPANALAEDTALSLSQATLSEFLPSSTGLVPLGEVVLDLSGETLGLSAELSIATAGTFEGDTLLVTRVVRIEGVPRVTVVGRATLSGGRLVSQIFPGLSGVTESGRYVFYRSAVPAGFVNGVTSASGTPIRAVVETAGLPFVAVSGADGSYVVAALAGTSTVSAYVPRTSLRGSATVDVVAGETSALDLALVGTLTTASVSPSDGAVGVPVSTQIDVTTTAAVNPASAVADTIKLFQGPVADDQQVALRFVLSGSGKSLAIVPLSSLEPATSYTLQVSGLADVFGGLVSVPEVTFTTRDDTPAAIDTTQITFSLPDANGIVQVEAPPGALLSGTTVLIVNAGNGVVLSLSAGNDGSLAGELPASISDRLLVSVTDPEGNVTSFERSQFVGADGTTAIGPGGGVVRGAGGVELRIPEGAVERGVLLKIEAFGPELFPERPELSGASFGGGLRIESAEQPRFEKEVDLVFPRPADAPEGAFYYVYRRLEGPPGADGEPIVAFETLDHAFVEGEGAGAKVVTSSYPFSGYRNSFGAYGVSGAIASVELSHAILMWSFDALLPGKALAGVITGRVLRTVWDPGASAPRFVGIPDAVVTGVDVNGNALLGTEGANLAVSQGDGTYTLWDERFTGGTYTVIAHVEGATKSATAFESDPLTSQTPGLQFYENVATANITFPPEAPAPPEPEIRIRVMTEAADGTRSGIAGLAVEGSPLLIGFRSEDAEMRGATVNGADLTLRRDSLPLTEPLAMDFVADFTPAAAGTYRVTASALTARAELREASSTFRVIAAGGSNDDPVPEQPPEVITELTVPKNNATGVPVNTFLQLTFTEPVKNVPGNVTLTDATGESVGFTLSGVGPSGPIAEVSTPDAVVTSLTLVPFTGLKFGTQYTLALTDGIEDQDTDDLGNPAPRKLVPFTTSFRTFGPETLGGTDERFGSAGLAVLGERAYLVENQFSSGTLRAYDITDPVAPEEIPSARAFVTGRPVDIAGEESTIVVATGPTTKSLPSNLWIFDVSTDAESRLVGAASVVRSAAEGFLQRITVDKGLAYTLTGRKGLQVVDLGKAVVNFDEATGGDLTSSGYWETLRKLNTSTEGFGLDAVAQTIPLEKLDGTEYFLSDLAVENLAGETHVAVAGGAPLLLVNAATGVVHPPVVVRTEDDTVVPPVVSELTLGSVVALGHIAARDVAVVAGLGTIAGGAQGLVLAVVDVSNPAAPATLSLIEIPLSGNATDILLTDDLAIVATESEAALVNLTDPAKPLFAGTIDGVGGVLALTDANILLSTARSAFGGDTELGGVQTAALGHLTVITNVIESPVLVSLDRKSIEPQSIHYRAIFPREDVNSSELELLRNDVVVQTFEAPLDDTGRGQITLPQGTEYPDGARVAARLVVNRDEPKRPQPTERALTADTFELFPAEAIAWSFADDPLDVAAVSTALVERLQEERDTPFPPLNLHWHAPQTQRDDIIPLREASPTGIYSIDFRPARTAGTVQFVELHDDAERILGRTGPITALAGNVTSAQPVPSLNDAAKIPADGKSVITVAIEQVKDFYGNVLPDGSRVIWLLEEGDGQILETESELVAGRASSRYQAGIELETAIIRADIQGRSEDAERFVSVEQVALDVEVKRLERVDFLTNMEVTVSSTAGPPADGTEVFWGTNQGGVTFQTTLSGGRSEAIYSAPVSASFPLFPTTGIFATVGRAKGVIADFPSTFVGGPEPDVVLGNYNLNGDNPGGAVEDFPGETTARYRGGAPGETITLELGTASFPVVQAFAAYPLDSLEDGVTGDAFGEPNLAATVGPGITVESSEPVQGDGYFHFTGSGALSIPDSVILQQANDLGVNGFVRFDRLEEGQTILEKQGSYGLHLIEDTGSFHLEFFTFSGGERKRVLSTQALAAATWYRFSAHIDSGQLRLGVGLGETGHVDFGDSPPIDLTTNPLTFGSSLEGDLDSLELYDFTRPALAVFANGQSTIDLTLDANGEATTTIRTTGVLAAPAEGAQGAPVVPVWRSFRATNPQSETFGSWFIVHTDRAIADCLDAITTGENFTASGIGCDLSLGFIPWVPIGQALRDVVIQLSNFVQGKETFFVVGAFGLLTLASSRLRILSGAKTVLDRGRSAFKGVFIERLLARDAMRSVRQAAETGAVELEPLSKIAGEAALDPARIALGDISEAIRNFATAESLQRLGTKYGDGGINGLKRILAVLSRISKRPGMDIQILTRVILYLDRLDFPRFSDDAIEGMAIFLQRVVGPRPFQGATRVPNILRDIQALAPAQQQQQVLNNLFIWIKQGEDVFARTALAESWEIFLRKGPGTLPRFSTSGNYHVLQYMSQVVGFEAVRGLEVRVARSTRFFDLQVERIVQTASGPVTRIVNTELKNLGANASYNFANQVLKDVKGAMARAGFVAGRTGDVASLARELQSLEYVLRGNPQQMQQIVQGIQSTIAKALRRGNLQALVPNVRITTLSLGLPF